MFALSDVIEMAAVIEQDGQLHITMRMQEIESWAVRVLDSLTKKGPTEDHFVELKSTWLPAQQIARRLAGHANSAPNDNILWLIGLDEKTGAVIGANPEELANWWPQVEAEFADRIAPELTSLTIQWMGISVVALAFRTDRAPYVVRNPAFGSVAGHSIAWEVPVRRGTRVETATRNNLITLLSPLLHLPKVGVRRGEVFLHEPTLELSWVQKCLVKLDFYLITVDESPISLDDRDCEVTVEILGYNRPTSITPSTLKPLASKHVEKNSFLTTVTGTTSFTLNTEGKIPSIGSQGIPDGARVTVKLKPLGFEQNISFTCLLREQANDSKHIGQGVSHYFVY